MIHYREEEDGGSGDGAADRCSEQLPATVTPRTAMMSDLKPKEDATKSLSDRDADEIPEGLSLSDSDEPLDSFVRKVEDLSSSSDEEGDTGQLVQSAPENPAFLLSGGSTGFCDRSRDIFAQLDSAAKLTSKDLGEDNILDGSFARPAPPSPPQAVHQKCVRPEATKHQPASKKLPDYLAHPERWTHYSLEDVPESSDGKNSQVAHQYIQELQESKRSQKAALEMFSPAFNQDHGSLGENKIVFSKPKNKEHGGSRAAHAKKEEVGLQHLDERVEGDEGDPLNRHSSAAKEERKRKWENKKEDEKIASSTVFNMSKKVNRKHFRKTLDDADERGLGPCEKNRRKHEICLAGSSGCAPETLTEDENASLIELENRNEPLLPPLRNSNVPRIYDYVLVANKVEDMEDQVFKKQDAFICELKKKNMNVLRIEHEGKVFFGVCAPKEIFQKYRYLLKVSDGCNWSGEVIGNSSVSFCTRIRMVHFVLNNTYLNSGESLKELLHEGAFESSFCLHEKQVQEKLKEKWASWRAVFSLFQQPVTDIKNYFGEKVALYYLWLGWYTRMLVPAAVIGVVVFLYGLAFFNTSPLIHEVCDSDTVMCPRCDKGCDAWNLSETCTYAKVWKRHRALYVSKWKVFTWCEDEEELILDILNDPHCRPKEHTHSYLQSIVVLLLVSLVLMVIIGLTHALVICRILAATLFSKSTWHFLYEHANTIAMLTGAVLHYITIQVMTRINKLVAIKLCEIEKTRSAAATERSFTVKMFSFQFFTLFSSLFYVAFFLGRINGYPGNYVRIAGKWRLEECHPSGCLTDLFIQMAVILVLKQTINNIFEFTVPWLKLRFLSRNAKKKRKSIAKCNRKECQEKPCDACKLRDWLANYELNHVDRFSLFNEFLEIVLQFSFTTIFVAAFPLAPLLALINNIFEIRLDAMKMVSLERRLVPKKTNDIGVWNKILEAVGVMAVIANGLVIGITSDFIPRLLYRHYYGPCANSTNANLDCMTGYISNTLSTAYMSNDEVYEDFKDSITNGGLNFTQCSYKDYRSDDDQTLTSQFWLILALRFAFVILFEHVVVICKFIAAWFIPDNPMRRSEFSIRRWQIHRGVSFVAQTRIAVSSSVSSFSRWSSALFTHQKDSRDSWASSFHQAILN
ncbi:hypothetical protein DNTS_026265 [Danionella cerebrum]|uniref:Anoctamin n=1 Tax=Danionella cerebrum TaxID=2873325 RepID=A0A553RD81_9TELE|nr:hypothetical protein DNTS_026265 [Danionella translucida]